MDKYKQEKLIEHVKTYRNPETEQKENAMDDFLYFVDRVSNTELSKEFRENLQVFVNEYVGYDIDKVKAGEKAMLERRING